MSTCVLIDCYDAVPGSQTVILSADHLRETLGAYATQEPRVLRMEGMAELLIRIGVGGPVGVVLVNGSGRASEQRVALAPTKHAADTVAFRYLGRPTPFPVLYLLPAAAVIDIVAYLYRTRELPSWVEWERRSGPA